MMHSSTVLATAKNDQVFSTLLFISRYRLSEILSSSHFHLREGHANNVDVPHYEGKAAKGIAMYQKLIKYHFLSDGPEDAEDPDALEPDGAGRVYQASPLPLL